MRGNTIYGVYQMHFKLGDNISPAYVYVKISALD